MLIGSFKKSNSVTVFNLQVFIPFLSDNVKDANGREFTVVLLDSEGIDSTSNRGFQDHQIFTLTVLLASVLIYNSQGVPTKSDVQELEYPIHSHYHYHYYCHCHFIIKIIDTVITDVTIIWGHIVKLSGFALKY